MGVQINILLHATRSLSLSLIHTNVRFKSHDKLTLWKIIPNVQSIAFGFDIGHALKRSRY